MKNSVLLLVILAWLPLMSHAYTQATCGTDTYDCCSLEMVSKPGLDSSGDKYNYSNFWVNIAPLNFLLACKSGESFNYTWTGNKDTQCNENSKVMYWPPADIKFYSNRNVAQDCLKDGQGKVSFH